MEQAQTLYQETGNPVQLFGAFDYQAESWARPRRIIHKAERMLPFGRFKGQTKFKIGTVLTAFLGHKVCLLVANIST